MLNQIFNTKTLRHEENLLGKASPNRAHLIDVTNGNAQGVRSGLQAREFGNKKRDGCSRRAGRPSRGNCCDLTGSNGLWANQARGESRQPLHLRFVAAQVGRLSLLVVERVVFEVPAHINHPTAVFKVQRPQGSYERQSPESIGSWL